MATEEQVGYRDAIRQVHRSLQRRLNHLEEELKALEIDKDRYAQQIRMEEVRHILSIVESLHR